MQPFHFQLSIIIICNDIFSLSNKSYKVCQALMCYRVDTLIFFLYIYSVSDTLFLRTPSIIL